MVPIKLASLRFSTATFAAAMLALYLALCIDLPRPYWAMITVYVVSQPMAAAVRSKALHRLLGTLLGAAAAVMLVPPLVNAPLLLSLALALWVGGCLAVSALDRSPRSYIVMLAGYTAAIIGFSSVNQPADVFIMAVARTEEIVLGIVCATLVHSLFFPQPLGDTLRTRVGSWLGEADHWALDILRGETAPALDHDRARMAGAASEIHMLASHLPFDTSHLRETTALVRALHDRILLLIPVLASLSERVTALSTEGDGPDRNTRQLMASVADWIAAGAPTAGKDALLRDLALQGVHMQGADWDALSQLSLLSRLTDLVRTLHEAHALFAHLDAPDALPSPSLAGALTAAGQRPLHSDPGLALLSGAAATISILLSCAVWIVTGWPEGSAAAINAAIVCCLFASMDDPAPAIRLFGTSLMIAVPLAGIYLFLLLPMIDSFPMLVMVLAPTMLTIGLIMLDPRRALPALVVVLNFANVLAIQEHFSANFAGFLNINLAQFVGLFMAIFVTRSMRSMSAGTSARRLLRQTWHNLARLARGRDAQEPAAFASRMVDRLGLLTPRLAAASDDDLAGIDALRELRTGMDLVALKELQPGLPAASANTLSRLLGAVGAHYAALSSGRPTDDSALLPLIDQALHRLATTPGSAARGLSALVGLRRNLFPAAPRYQAGLPEGAA
ncbi:MAG TPA: FUSC family protein [Methyloversatilis sp.]